MTYLPNSSSSRFGNIFLGLTNSNQGNSLIPFQLSSVGVPKKLKMTES